MADHARIAAKSPATWIELPDFAAPDGLLSAREAAAALGINERTIRRAIARGDLRAVKHGRAYQITSAALDHYRLQRRPPALESGKDHAREPPVLLALPTKARTTLAGLPAPFTRFIGRQREIAAISALLGHDDVRLLTLTGSGGVGKTRLALRVAEEVANRFAAGVVFVSLASVGSPNLVLPAIARALDLRASADRPLKTTLIAALRARRLLLVLDNLEHLVGAANDIADLLVECPELAILMTSRAPLGLSGEQQFPILPLALPREGESLALDRLQTYEAIALFIERARHVRPDFALDAGNAKAVLEICRRLDGLPLALELAAPWLRVLSPGALLARLDRRLPLLTGGAPDRPARFRTMRDAIAWSYDLLSHEERRLFRCLAVFVGGFTLDAAEQVARRSRGLQETSSREGDATPAYELPPSPHHPITPSPSSVTLALLAALIDKSLVQPVDADGQEPRYQMLETVREFSLEQLVEDGEEPATRAAHAAHYLAIAEVAGNDKDGIGASEWMPRLAPERPNMRLALDWFDHTGDAEAVLQMTGALWHYWYLFGDLAEGRSRLERALAAAPPGVNPVHQARALRGLGVIARQSADYERSQALLEGSLATYRAIGDRAGAAWALNSLGCLFGTLSDERRAETHLSEALAIFRDIGDAVGTAQLTANLAELAVMAGHHSLAIERLEAALGLWHALGDRVGEARAQVYLAQMALARGNPARAEAALSAALIAIRDNAYEQILPVALRTAAQLAVRRGNAAAAARWCGAEEALRAALGMELSSARRASHERTITAVRAALGEAAFTTSWSEGRGLSADQVVAEVLAGTDTAAAEPAALDDARLSPREREVFRLLVSGHSDREIADALFITRRTASKHVSAILAKLGVPSRTAAVAFAMQSGHA